MQLLKSETLKHETCVPVFQRPGKDRDSKYKHTHVSAHEESFSHVCMYERTEKTAWRNVADVLVQTVSCVTAMCFWCKKSLFY